MNPPNQSSNIHHLDINHELCSASEAMLRHVPEQAIFDISMLLNSAPSVFILGVGHSGLLSRVLSMKLNHVGLDAYTVFDEINPPFEKGSVLVAVSQSGETATITALAEKARTLDGKIVAFTGNAASTLGRTADAIVELRIDAEDVLVEAFAGLGGVENQNVRGAFFGHALYAAFYSIVLLLAQTRNENPQSINSRHANLE